jgi:hypothetical protein
MMKRQMPRFDGSATSAISVEPRHRGFARPRNISLAACALLFSITTAALANPTQEDVFRSVNRNLDTPVDMSRAVPYLLAVLGFLILVIIYHFHQKRQNSPHPLNHSGKLAREVARTIALRPAELKQLKILAEQQELEHPLTLILCPSALGKAIRAPGARIDRAIVKQIVQRLKQSLT